MCPLGQIEIMSCDDEREASFLGQIGQQLVKSLAVLLVEVSRWFVCQDKARVVHERPSDSDALLLTTGEFAGLVVGTLLQSDFLKQCRCPALSFREFLASNQSWHRNIFESRELGQEMMKLENES